MREAQRLRALEEESRAVKLLVAHLSVRGAALRGVIRKKLEFTSQREVVAHA